MNDDERFFLRVNKDGPLHPVLGTQCWDWTGCRDKAGYGHFRFEKGKAPGLAHRFVMRDLLQAGLDVLHHCDRPPCVRREHLFLGTHTDNMRDSIAKGRNAFKLGEEHNLSKLTDEQAMIIKARPRAVGVVKKLMQAFDISRPTIYYVDSARGWRHLPAPTPEDFARAEAFLATLTLRL